MARRRSRLHEVELREPRSRLRHRAQPRPQRARADEAEGEPARLSLRADRMGHPDARARRRVRMPRVHAEDHQEVHGAGDPVPWMRQRQQDQIHQGKARLHRHGVVRGGRPVRGHGRDTQDQPVDHARRAGLRAPVHVQPAEVHELLDQRADSLPQGERAGGVRVHLPRRAARMARRTLLR